MDPIRFRLFVAGQSLRSQRAISSLRALGESLGAPVEVEVVDVVSDPETAEHARILTTPTVIKESPLPVRRVTGDLSDGARVLYGLGLEAAEPRNAEPEPR